jgi:hypothetical protein
MRARWKPIIIRTFLLGLITIIGIVSAVLISIRCHQGFEPAIADCPIAWGTYSLGINHNLLFLNNRPLTSLRIARYLEWINAVTFRVARWTPYYYDCLSLKTLTPTLIVHLGLLNQSSPIGVLVLRNGRRSESAGTQYDLDNNTRRYRTYDFDELPQDVRGCVVEFFLPGQTNVIGRLRL